MFELEDNPIIPWKLKNSPPGDCFEGYSALFVRDGTNTPSRRPEHVVSSGNDFRDFHS